jgi:uncharacterized protein YoaH (UPF0181 family)
VDIYFFRGVQSHEVQGLLLALQNATRQPAIPVAYQDVPAANASNPLAAPKDEPAPDAEPASTPAALRAPHPPVNVSVVVTSTHNEQDKAERRPKEKAAPADADPQADDQEEAPSSRLRAKRADSGRRRAVIKHRGDRHAIRAEIDRVMNSGVSQAEAFRQVAEQAQRGRAGQHALTQKYNLPPDEATASVIRRIFEAKW